MTITRIANQLFLLLCTNPDWREWYEDGLELAHRIEAEVKNA